MELDKIVDPILLFKNWLSKAEKNEIRDPNAMQLATVSKNGMPSVRTVLLKDIIDTIVQTLSQANQDRRDDITCLGIKL